MNMDFTVTWHPDAEDELTELWLASSDREAITRARQMRSIDSSHLRRLSREKNFMGTAFLSFRRSL